MPSKSKAELIKTVEGQAEIIKILEDSNMTILKTLQSQNDHLKDLIDDLKKIAVHVKMHTTQLGQLTDDVAELQAVVADKSRETEPLDKQPDRTTYTSTTSGNVSELTATKERECGSTMASAMQERHHGRHDGPPKGGSGRTVSSTTVNEGDEGTAQKNDEHHAHHAHHAHDKAAAADDKAHQTHENHEDAPRESPTEIHPEVREQDGGFRYEHDLADIATTLAVAPQGQGDSVLKLSPRTRRSREYPDREDHPKRHRVCYDAVGGQTPNIPRPTLTPTTDRAATARPATKASWAAWIWEMGKWLLLGRGK